MEKDTVEVVPDNSVTTRLDENLISALKRALPSEPVTATGKFRDGAGKSMREPRERSEEPFDLDSENFASDPGYEGIGVTVSREWKTSAGALQFTLQVNLGLFANTRRREWRFCDMLSKVDDCD